MKRAGGNVASISGVLLSMHNMGSDGVMAMWREYSGDGGWCQAMGDSHGLMRRLHAVRPEQEAI
jgi:hypothetical protein